MLRVIIRMLPGMRDPSEWRIEFSERAGERPVVHVFRGSLDELKTFLQDRVEVPAAKLAGVVGSLAASNIAHLEMPDMDLAEAKALTKQVQREAKQAAAGGKSGSGMGEQQTSPMHAH